MVGLSRLKRLSLILLEHAASTLPPDSSAWSIAMLREADYIESDREVLFWATGCLAAAYRRKLSATLTPDSGRRFGRRIAYTAVMGILGLNAINCASGKTIPGVPVFERTVCDLPDLAPDLVPRIECGTVAVPRDRASPQTGTFRLAVVVIKAVGSGAALADPVVYVAGGPGSPLTSRAALIARHEAAVVAPDRDLILVDQRGAGRSEPALCPGLARKQVAIFANGADQAALVKAWRDSFAQCRRDMAGAGLDPAWFGTSVTTADFEDVRQALGIERWNVYALSYGTAVASTMLAQQPAHLRAVVLDSVFPPDPLPMTMPQSFARALELLFAACRAQAACAVAHPDLAGAYRDALRTLDAAALSVPMSDGLGIKTVNLRAELFRLIVNRALYSRGAMASLPAFIDAARDRDPVALQGLVAGTVHGYLSMSVGDMEAVECRDRPSWHVAAPNDSTDPPVSAFVAGSCADWSPLGPPPLIAESTQVPTLILAGRVDPITPPSFAWQAAAGMGQMARVVEFAHVGHGVQQASACGEHSVTAFIQAPASNIGACAEAVPPVRFR